MRKFLKLNEIEALKEYAGPDCYARLHANRHVCCKHEGAYLLAFRFCDIRSAAQKDDKVCIYCSERELIYVCDNKRCIQFANGIDDQLANYRQLLEFFFAMTADDVYELEKTEDRITGIEDSFLTKKKTANESPAKIISLRLGLLKMKRYYEQLSLITSELAEDDDNIIPDELQKRFSALDRRIDHLLNSVLHLREYITQVREAYQAQIDIEQNQIMKVFTVISAVFLPLTLIVGWYGMNLQMPEFGWKFGYLYVSVLCLVVFAVCLAIFKFKKWF